MKVFEEKLTIPVETGDIQYVALKGYSTDLVLHFHKVGELGETALKRTFTS